MGVYPARPAAECTMIVPIPLLDGDNERANLVHLLGSRADGTEIGEPSGRCLGEVDILLDVVPQPDEAVLETGRLEPAHIFAVLPELHPVEARLAEVGWRSVVVICENI